MVLVAIWEARDRRQAIKQGDDIGYEGGKAIGYAQASVAWLSWLHRRETASANGLPFNEPMPDAASIRNRHRTPNPPPSHPA